MRVGVQVKLKKYFKSEWIRAGLIIAGIFLVYFNSLNAPFILDDNARIVNNPDIRKLSNLKSQLVYPHDVKDKRFWKYWERNDPSRPVVYFTYTLNYYFGKYSSFGYRLFNVAFHALNAVLVFFLVKLLLQYAVNIRSAMIPFYTALLFALHPVNTDAVSYVTGRSNVLAAFFYMLSLLFFIKTIKDDSRFYIPSLICFIFSVFSKQIAVTLPVVIFFFDYIFISNYRIKGVFNRKSYHIPYWAILACYLLFRYFYFGSIGDIEAYSTWGRHLYTCVQPYVILNYIKMLLLSAGLSFVHIVRKPVTFFEIRIIASFLSMFIMFFLIYRLHKKKSDISKLAVFASLWFFITLSPTSSFFPTTQAMVERRVYLPGFGFCLLIALAYYLLGKSRIAVVNVKLRYALLAVMAVHISVFGILTYKRNSLFMRPAFLWKEIVKKYPGNAVAHNNLGAVYMERGEYREALEHFKKAVMLNPTDEKFHKNLGKIYFYLKMYDRAVQKYKDSIKIDKSNYRIYNDLGLVYFQQKKYTEAIKYYAESIRINPGFADAHNNTAAAYYSMQEYSKALAGYKKAVNIQPDYAEARYNLGLTYQKLNNTADALSEYNMAIKSGLDSMFVYYNVGNIYFEQKNYAKAIMNYEKAVEIEPDSAAIHKNLGLLYHRVGEYEKAVEEYSKAVELESDN